MAFDMGKYVEQFHTETKERIQNLNNGLLELEKSPEDKKTLDYLMREAHTIKGNSMIFEYGDIVEVAHAVEDGFSAALSGKVRLTGRHFDMLFEGVDAIEKLLNDKISGDEKGLENTSVADLCAKIKSAFQS